MSGFDSTQIIHTRANAASFALRDHIANAVCDAALNKLEAYCLIGDAAGLTILPLLAHQSPATIWFTWQPSTLRHGYSVHELHQLLRAAAALTAAGVSTTTPIHFKDPNDGQPPTANP